MKKILPLIMFFKIINLQAEEIASYKFGIVPQQSATQLMEMWAPLIKTLSVKCKCKVVFTTATDISTFEKNVKNGDYDLVYLNPMHFVQSQSVGYTALAREDGRRLKGIVVVKSESTITQISDLTNKTVAFPGPTSFAATTLVENMFKQKDIPIKPLFVKSHASVYLDIISGLVLAGGGVNRTFDALPMAEKAKLKILATTQEVTPHPIAIHKRVDAKHRAIFQSTLAELKDTIEGKQILDKLEFKTLVVAKDSDWDDVRKIIAASGVAP
jgi:phosphonate transport system substrate-binding protein